MIRWLRQAGALILIFVFGVELGFFESAKAAAFPVVSPIGLCGALHGRGEIVKKLNGNPNSQLNTFIIQRGLGRFVGGDAVWKIFPCRQETSSFYCVTPKFCFMHSTLAGLKRLQNVSGLQDDFMASDGRLCVPSVRHHVDNSQAVAFAGAADMSDTNSWAVGRNKLFAGESNLIERESPLIGAGSPKSKGESGDRDCRPCSYQFSVGVDGVSLAHQEGVRRLKMIGLMGIGVVLFLFAFAGLIRR